MIKWKLYKVTPAFQDVSWRTRVHYNDSEYVSWLATGGPNSPIFDYSVLREKEVKETIDTLMDIVLHVRFLLRDYDDFMVRELLGI
jgi:hypothetical protein